MKRGKFLFFGFVLALLLQIEFPTVAVETGFVTEELSNERITELVQFIRLTPLSEEPEIESMDCFAVSENGLVAVGYDGEKAKIISVYNGDGEFQYGYRFNSHGSFEIAWSEDDIIIYFWREAELVAVDASGSIQEVLAVPEDIKENDTRLKQLEANEKTIGEKTYRLQNDMGLLDYFAFSYSQLIVTQADGREVVFLDTTHAYMPTAIWSMAIRVFVFVSVPTAIFVVLKRRKRCKNQ